MPTFLDTSAEDRPCRFADLDPEEQIAYRQHAARICQPQVCCVCHVLFNLKHYMGVECRDGVPHIDMRTPWTTLEIPRRVLRAMLAEGLVDTPNWRAMPSRVSTEHLNPT